jgi:ribose transport system ATP-binding protein
MIGKVVDESAGSVKAMRKPTGEVLLHVDGLSGGGFHDIHFDLHKGEILGFGGLIGAGRTELVRAIYGIDAFSGGCITYDGEKFCSNPKASIRAGIGFVPEDRRGQGFIPLLSTTRNVALTNYDIIRKKGAAIDRHDELDMAKRAIVKMDIRPSDPAKPVGLMSGGNQQKVVLGKWLMRDLKLLIVDEPTAGIDVGAKDEIYNILEDLAKSGVAVILVTSDLQELIRVSHRILVMRKGSIVKEFDSGNVTQSDVLEAASGLVEKEDSAS